MRIEMQTGLYGKLPAHGDFIHRNLNSGFVQLWDDWLQLFIASGREQLGEDWLNIYLTSPIWRFSLSPGVLDEFAWIGVLMPSVDRVGRYFPISVLRPFPDTAAPVNLVLAAGTWFNQVEERCLDALEGSIDADALIESVLALEVELDDDYLATEQLGDNGPQVFGLGDDSGESINRLLPYWLGATLSSALPSHSVWHTEGSELVGPVLFCSQGLPPVRGIASMLDGQWQQRDWKIPFNLQLSGVVDG